MAGIQISGLSKSYGGEGTGAAVESLDLDIKDNQFVTLLGPSGCGKTTTLRLIAGYLKPDSGTIRIDDRVMSSASDVTSPAQRGMGMVFQNYAVWPHKTVFENVVFGLRLRKISAADAKARVENALALVNLDGLGGRFPSELSGGQQQRVALARSLVVEPGILLLDEPLSNLDAKLRERMRVELKQLQRRTGITFVYVTHDQGEALELSDQIAVMHGGRLQQYGAPEDVYRRPANKIVADFMGIVNFLSCAVRAAPDGKGLRAGIGDVDFTVGIPAGNEAGTPIDIAVRPEDIRLKRSKAENAVPGVVRERVFLGNIMEYWVEIADGTKLRVQTHPGEKFEVGESVFAEIDARECSVFPRHDRT